MVANVLLRGIPALVLLAGAAAVASAPPLASFIATQHFAP